VSHKPYIFQGADPPWQSRQAIILRLAHLFLSPINFFEAMTNKLSLQEALKKLARYRHAVVKRDRNDRFKVRPAHRADANDEFYEQPSADMAWFVGALAALTLISWFAVKWL
jgi:hypothetical protein